MAIKIRETTYTHTCPNCKSVVKVKNESDALMILYVFLFIPVGLIALIVKIISIFTKKKTEYGEEILNCPNCGKYLALSSNYLTASTRVIISQNELLSIISPAIGKIQKSGITCNKYNLENTEFSEAIALQFINTLSEKKCDIFIKNIIKKLYIIENNNLTEYSHQNLITIVVTALM